MTSAELGGGGDLALEVARVLRIAFRRAHLHTTSRSIRFDIARPGRRAEHASEGMHPFGGDAEGIAMEIREQGRARHSEALAPTWRVDIPSASRKRRRKGGTTTPARGR